jgi:hypothetical protein
MNTGRSDKDSREEHSSRAAKEDLDALRATTARGLPSLGRTRRELEARVGRPVPTGPVRWRWAAVTGFGLAVGVALLALPVSYQREVGCEVLLTLKGDNLRPAAAQNAAQELARAFGASEVRVRALMDGPGYVLSAQVAPRPRAQAEAMAAVLAGRLADDRVAVEHEARPVTKHESRSVGRLAGEMFVSVRLGGPGRSLAEIARDLRRQLVGAGFDSTRVTLSPDGGELTIRPQHDSGAYPALLALRVVFEREDGDSLVITSLQGDAKAAREMMTNLVKLMIKQRGVEADVYADEEGHLIVTVPKKKSSGR